MMENLDNFYFYLDSKEAAFKSDTATSFSIKYGEIKYDFEKYEAALLGFGYLPKAITKNVIIYICSNICSDKNHVFGEKNLDILRCHYLKKVVAKTPTYRFIEFQDRAYVNLATGKFNVIKMDCMTKVKGQFVNIDSNLFQESFFILHVRKISPFK